MLIEQNNGDLLPTKKLEYTWRIRKNGCFVYPYESEESKYLLNELVKDGYFRFCSALLAPQESDYFSYFYHDKDFSNALALRNEYAHGHDLEEDPNGKPHIANYYRAIQLLLQLIIKIDNELSLSMQPGLKIELVDWPLMGLESGALKIAEGIVVNEENQNNA